MLPGGESNPGLPRDRRGYSPLYYRGLIYKVSENMMITGKKATIAMNKKFKITTTSASLLVFSYLLSDFLAATDVHVTLYFSSFVEITWLSI